jgi:hypothetical protein
MDFPWNLTDDLLDCGIVNVSKTCFKCMRIVNRGLTCYRLSVELTKLYRPRSEFLYSFSSSSPEECKKKIQIVW